MQVIVAVLFLAAAANAAAVVPVETSVVKSDRVGDNFAYSIHSTTGVVPGVVPDVKHVVPTTYVAGVPFEVRDGEVVRKVVHSPYVATVPVHDGVVASVPYVHSVVNPVVNPVVSPVVNPVVSPVSPYSYLPYSYGYGYPYVKV